MPGWILLVYWEKKKKGKKENAMLGWISGLGAVQSLKGDLVITLNFRHVKLASSLKCLLGLATLSRMRTIHHPRETPYQPLSNGYRVTLKSKCRIKV